MTDSPPIIIVGGGMIGLTLGCALVQQSQRVVVIDTQLPTLHWHTPTARVSAINHATINILKNLNIWPRIDDRAKTPLRHMSVWDASFHGAIDFDATEVNQPHIGMIVENRAIIRALWNNLTAHPLATLVCPATPLRITQDEQQVTLTLDHQTTITGQLLIGADGANSWVRQHASFNMKHRPYHHDAITTVIQTSQPHQHTAYQSFTPQGPIGLLPLHDLHHSSIVWSIDPEYATELQSLTPKAFNMRLTETLDYRLGKAHSVIPCTRYPLIMRHVNAYYDRRIALIGDAAHTIHPLAGQGANLGFLDAATLAACLNNIHHNNHPQSVTQALARFQRHSRPRNMTMARHMRAFQQAFGSSSELIGQWRSFGLTTANQWPWLKRYCMKTAMATQGDLPPLAFNTQEQIS